MRRGDAGGCPAGLAFNPRSDGPERVGGRETGGADGGEQSSDGADRERGAEAAGPGEGGDDRGPVLGVSVDRGRDDAEDDAGDAAEQGEQDRLSEELGADMTLGCAQGTAKPD